MLILPFPPRQIRYRVFQSCVFHPCKFHGPAFSSPAFSASPFKPSFIVFDIWALWLSALSVTVPVCQKLQMTTQTGLVQDALLLYPYGNSGRQRVNVEFGACGIGLRRVRDWTSLFVTFLPVTIFSQFFTNISVFLILQICHFQSKQSQAGYAFSCWDYGRASLMYSSHLWVN